jgi:hypothetical protein
MSKLITMSSEELLNKATQKLVKQIELILNKPDNKKPPEQLLFDLILFILNKYPNFAVNRDKTLQDKFSDIMNVLSSAALTMIERYCDGNRAGAYYAADMMSKMIMRRLSEKHEAEEGKIEVSKSKASSSTPEPSKIIQT